MKESVRSTRLFPNDPFSVAQYKDITTLDAHNSLIWASVNVDDRFCASTFEAGPWFICYWARNLWEWHLEGAILLVSKRRCEIQKRCWESWEYTKVKTTEPSWADTSKEMMVLSKGTGMLKRTDAIIDIMLASSFICWVEVITDRFSSLRLWELAGAEEGYLKLSWTWIKSVLKASLAKLLSPAKYAKLKLVHVVFFVHACIWSTLWTCLDLVWHGNFEGWCRERNSKSTGVRVTKNLRIPSSK